ncbi:MAG: hypothetical protein N2C14_30900 [Planctomycetales bacterium]
MTRRTRFLGATSLLAIFGLSASFGVAGKVAVWRHDSAAEFSKGKLQGVVVDSAGAVSLAREVSEVADLKAASVWRLGRATGGRLVAVTSEPAKLVEITKDDRVRTLWQDEATQAFSLWPLADGSVLVGTGPKGKILKISPAAKVTEHAALDALYVWDLLGDDDGNLYAATGPKGKVFKITPDGKTELFFETKQPHALALAFDRKGRLLIGTDGDALIWSVAPDGSGRVLYDAAEAEIRSLWVGADGSVFAGTASGKATKTASSSSSSSSSAASAAAAAKGKAGVYRIDPQGGVRKALAVAGTTYCLVPSLGKNGRKSPPNLFAGTGAKGVVHAFDPISGTHAEVARLDAEQVLCASVEENGDVLLGTGNTGKVFRLSAARRKEGSLLSAALDATMNARFGSVGWQAETPEGCQASVRLRSGNTSKPDDSWSKWSKPLTDPADSRANCPPARFLQYELILKTNDPSVSPLVRSASLRYQTANQPPRITKFEIPRVDEGDGAKKQEKLKLTWTAEDPNKDDLHYALSFRKPDWKTWISLKKSLTAVTWEWDVTSIPQGVYLLRLEASDHPSNAPGDAQQDERISAPFVVDSQPPEIALECSKTRRKGCVFTAEIQDQFSPIAKAAYSLDGGDWVNVFPEDGLFDAAKETFRAEVPNLTPGLHVLVLRATDAAGHSASADLVLEIPARKRKAAK